MSCSVCYPTDLNIGGATRDREGAGKGGLCVSGGGGRRGGVMVRMVAGNGGR